MMRKTIIFVFIAFMFLPCCTALASEPYIGYNYDSWNMYEPVPNAYEPVRAVDGASAGTSPFKTPEDMSYRDGLLYILDSGNGRVVVLDGDYRFQREIEAFTGPGGEEFRLNEPRGLFVSGDGRMIIADTKNNRVLVCDLWGKVELLLERPDSDIFPPNLEYKPIRVLSDSKNCYYVLCDSFYYGAIMFDEHGRFIKFYGSNLVEVSFAQAFDRMFRRFMTRIQSGYMARYVSVNFNSFDIDADDFIYTCSRFTSSMNEVRKLNALGQNVLRPEISYDTLNRNDYGEKERFWYNGNYIDSVLIDISVSENGLINALDFIYGRVYQYDQDSNLLAVFGGMSGQTGMFRVPAAVESVGGDVLVLDSEKASFTIFSPTEYGLLIHRATALYTEGYYQEALAIWREVLRFNGNSEQAYRGIGRAYLEQGEYKVAMEYLRTGQDRYAYSKAYGYYRAQVVKDNFAWIAAAIILILLVFFSWGRLTRIIRRYFPVKQTQSRVVNPFYCMLHPIEGPDEIRLRGGARQLALSGGIITAWFIISIIERQATGFIFNLNRVGGLNLWIMAGKTFGLFILFAICNWAVGSLTDGEAKMAKIINVGACAIVPAVAIILIHTIASNFIIFEEGALFGWLRFFALLYSFFMLFTGIMTAQQYTFGKTVLSLFLTVAGMVVILFIITMLFSLFQQVYIFIMSIYNELMFRA